MQAQNGVGKWDFESTYLLINSYFDPRKMFFKQAGFFEKWANQCEFNYDAEFRDRIERVSFSSSDNWRQYSLFQKNRPFSFLLTERGLTSSDYFITYIFPPKIL